MHFCLEGAGSDVEKDFSTALNLLHSTDDDSAYKLGQMLDDLIAKKCGPSKTLGARNRGEHLLRKSREIKIQSGDEKTKDRYLKIEDPFSFTAGANQTNSRSQITSGATVITKKIGQNIANILVALDKTDIPTISIPDEVSSANDDALCKICNGGKLGPLILLECQECQDVYHPLCHHPPVLDLDIYDPRLVWHCAKCVELSNAAAIINATNIAEDKKFELCRRESQEIFKHQVRSTGSIITDNHPNEHHNYFRRNDDVLLHHQDNSETTIKRVFTTGNGSSKNNQSASVLSTSTSSSSSSSAFHLRKRVGSKLTMNRSTSANK